MTIEQTDKIDGMGIDRDMNELVLIISDHLSWDDEGAHLTLIENKLGAYLTVIRSRQYLETIPHAQDLAIRIRLVHENRPPVSAEAVLKTIEEQLCAMGIRFSHGGLPAEF